MKKSTRWLNRDLVTSPYCYALCLNEKAFDQELKRLKVPKNKWPNFLLPHSNACVHYFEASEHNGLCAIVCLGDTKNIELIQINALLVHEAVHIWQRIKEVIGETNPGYEMEAYSIQRLSQSLMYSYDEQISDKK